MNPQVFFEEFGAIANAPGGIQRLREMILQLAVMGKLVEQNPEDEPASELLSTIEVLKSKAVGAKGKSLPRVTDDEKYFILPKNWVWCRLGEIIFFTNGLAFKSTQLGNNGIGVVKIGDIQDECISISKMSYIKEDFIENLDSLPKLNPGEMVIAMSGATTGKLGFNKTESVFLINQRVGKINGIIVDDNYLFKFLSTKVTENLKKSFGSAIPNLSTKQINEICVPLPPLEEQKRIVAKVDQLMALCDQLEAQQQKRSKLIKNTRISALEALANAQGRDELQIAWKRVEKNLPLLFENSEDVEDLKKCILQNAVMGKLVPKAKFEIKELKDLITFGPKNGLSPKGVNFVTKTKVFTLSATTKGIVDRSKYKYTDNEIEEDSHLWLEEGNILIQRGNSKEYVGVSAVYNGPSHEYIYPDLMMKVIADPQKILVPFLHLSLSAPQAREYMWERLSGTSSTMPKINQKIVNSIPINLPSIEVQKIIVEKNGNLLSLCGTLQNQLKSSQKIAEQLAQSVVESITGISTEKQEKMKTPKTELVTKLKLVKKPRIKDKAPLSTILAKNNDGLSANGLWNSSGLSIDAFYQQLKAEMLKGWIAEPQKAEVHIIEEQVEQS